MNTLHESPSPRWRRLPEERPGQILDAAIDVFGERGLAGARLEDIARRAGVSKGTIYLYFPNKEALFREVVRAKVVGHIEQAEAARGEGPFDVRLRRCMAAYWEFLRSPTFEIVQRLVHGELHQFPDLAEFYSREVIMRGKALLQDTIREGIESGEIRPIDPAVAARMLVAMLVQHAGWCSRRTVFRHLADNSDAEVFDQVMDFFLDAIRAMPDSDRPATQATRHA